MIWLETSPEATRLQVVFRSNQKNKQTNKQTKTTDAKVGTICYLFASLLFYNAWVQCKTKYQCGFHYIYMRIFTKKTSCTWKEWNENMILTFSKDSKKFFIDKSYGVLIEVAICSPGNIQLPSLNAYFSQFPKTAYYDASIYTTNYTLNLQTNKICNCGRCSLRAWLSKLWARK